MTTETDGFWASVNETGLVCLRTGRLQAFLPKSFSPWPDAILRRHSRLALLFERLPDNIEDHPRLADSLFRIAPVVFLRRDEILSAIEAQFPLLPQPF